MIESYIVLAGRIRKELEEIERLVSRANRAIRTAQKNLTSPLSPAGLYGMTLSCSLGSFRGAQMDRLVRHIGHEKGDRSSEWHGEVLYNRPHG